MDDPFAILDGGEPQKPVEEYEEVNGAFTCQTNGCWSTVGVAKYFPEAKLFTWKCRNGHISKILDFEL